MDLSPFLGGVGEKGMSRLLPPKTLLYVRRDLNGRAYKPDPSSLLSFLGNYPSKKMARILAGVIRSLGRILKRLSKQDSG